MEATKFSWAALFGGVTVVGSLLLVAWEIRQNTHALSAQAIQNLNTMTNQATLLVAENTELAALIVKRGEDLEALSSSERLQRDYFFYAVVASFEAAHVFHSKSLLNEVDYSGWRRSTCGFLHETSDGINLWESQRDSFGDEFIAFVDTQCVQK